MHVIVGVFPELIEVRRHRIFDLKLHRAFFVVWRAPEGSRTMIVNSSSLANGAMMVWPEGSVHGSFWRRGSGTPAGVEHSLQQRQSLISRGDAGQIAGSGMARGAAAGAVEIAAAGRGVAGCQVRGVHGAAPAAERFGLGFLIVDESDDRGQIRIAQAERRASPGPVARREPAVRSYRRDCLRRPAWSG